MQFEKGTHVFIPDQSGKDVVLAAKVVQSFSPGTPGKVTLLHNNKTVKLAKAETKGIVAMTEQNLKGLRDMVKFKELNEFSILHNLRLRYESDVIYTGIGKILLSVNPFKQLDIYSPEFIEKYLHNGSRGQDPHVFGVADDAFQAMIEGGKDQSVLCSGESGSGKTEACKSLLTYISEKSRQRSQVKAQTSIQQKIMESNPIIEAFGNATTQRNDNSSRFGKLINVQFNRNSGAIEGSHIKSYLLEKIRVVNHAERERSFHCFYQFCAAVQVDPKLKEKYGIEDATQYFYLNQSKKPSTIVSTLNDKSDWLTTLNALSKCGFSEEDKENIINVMMVIMNVGNVKFAGGEVAKVENMDQVTKTAALVGCPAKDLERSLVKQDRSTPADPDLVSDFDAAQACDARDAFAKQIYSLLFDWIISKINLSLGEAKKGPSIRAIGVLDIFGFEFFERNSFEQLCINTTNEYLQAHFNQHIFSLEMQQYKKEGIDVTKIEFEDNSHVLTAIDSKAGIMGIISNELKLRTATDDSLLGKFKALATADKKNGNKAVVSMPSNKEIKKVPDYEKAFVVKHFAGPVTYITTDFLDKNRDNMPKLCEKLCKASKNSFISSLFQGTAAVKKEALGVRFCTQLRELMSHLNSTEPHFIRTIKPNMEKSKDNFDSEMIMDQLRYAGVLEVCRIRAMGYPVRRTYQDFLNRYKIIKDTPVSDHKQLIEEFLKMKICTDRDIQIGNSKVFMKNSVADDLEELRGKALGKFVVIMQKVVRGYLVRRVAKKWKAVLKEMDSAIASKDKEKLSKAILNFGILPFSGKHLKVFKQAKRLIDRIIEEEKTSQLLLNACEARDLEQLKVALQAAKKKDLLSLPAAVKADKLVKQIEEEIEVTKSLEIALKSKEEAKLVSAIAKAKALSMGGKSVTDAETMLKQLTIEKDTKNNLKNALKKDDKDLILKFMTEMANIGLSDHKLVKEAEQVIKVKARAEAAVQEKINKLMYDIEKAIKQKNLAALVALNDDVIKLGVSNKTTLQAAELRVQLEKEHDLLKRLNAQMVNLRAKAQSKAGLVEEDLKEAKDSYNAAIKVISGEDDQMSAALRDFKMFDKSIKANNRLKVVLQEYAKENAAIKAEKDGKKVNDMQIALVKKLKEANALAAKTGLETETAADIRDKLNNLEIDIDNRNEEANESERQKRLDKLKEATEKEQKDLEAERLKLLGANLGKKFRKQLTEASDNTKYSLDKYYKIRTDEDYVSKVSESMKEYIAKGKLLSQTKIITKSISRLPYRENSTAVRINKAILQYCGDLHVNFPAAMAYFILMQGLQDPAIVDEIYIQLIKHITGNRREESADRAWLLMCMATKTFPPPEEFTPFLLNFLIKERGLPGLVGNYARLSIVQLDATITLGATMHKPNTDELMNYRKRPPILATIHSLTGKKYEIPVTPEMRVSNVLEQMKAHEGVIEDNDQPVWGLYVSAEEEKDVDTPKERLIKFYRFYNPTKLAHVETFLNLYKGNIELLFENLERKYGPEPDEDEKDKQTGILALPITAAKNAAKFFGFGGQEQTPPSPKCPWTLPWWTFLGDVYFRMSRQKKVPRFLFKRRLITKQEPVDKWLYIQAVHDVRTGFLPIHDDKMIAHLAALCLVYDKGGEIMDGVSSYQLEDAGVMKYIPNVSLQRTGKERMLRDVGKVLLSGKLPDKASMIMAAYVASVRALPTYGMNFFYARHSASEKNYVMAVDIDGIHVLEEDRADIKRTFVFDTIKKFGVTPSYFWMNVDENEEEKQSLLSFLTGSSGINVLLYTLQSWELYDCVFDATHVGIDDEEEVDE